MFELAFFFVPEPNMDRVKEEKKKNKSLGQKRKHREKASEPEATKVDQYSSEGKGIFNVLFFVFIGISVFNYLMFHG